MIIREKGANYAVVSDSESDQDQHYLPAAWFPTGAVVPTCSVREFLESKADECCTDQDAIAYLEERTQIEHDSGGWCPVCYYDGLWNLEQEVHTKGVFRKLLKMLRPEC